MKLWEHLVKNKELFLTEITAEEDPWTISSFYNMVSNRPYFSGTLTHGYYGIREYMQDGKMNLMCLSETSLNEIIVRHPSRNYQIFTLKQLNEEYKANPVIEKLYEL